MDSSQLSADKAALRKSMKSVRKQAQQSVSEPEQQLWAASQTLVNSLPPGSVVGGYAPIQSEFPTWQLMRWLEDAGHQLALPLVVADNTPLTFLGWSSDTPLIEGAFGAKTPDPSIAPTLKPNVLLVPLLAFDDSGYRLGYGGGFYDRSIALYEPKVTVGVAYAAQRVESVPVGSYDLALNYIATERGVTERGILVA